LVVAKLREGLFLFKQATWEFSMQKFYLKKLYSAEVRKYPFTISNSFSALKNLDVNFSVSNPALFRYSAFVRYWRRNWSTVGLFRLQESLMIHLGSKRYTAFTLNLLYH
jgi:hypothetical protein